LEDTKHASSGCGHNPTTRAGSSALKLPVALALLALPVSALAATAGCPTAPPLKATTYDAAVAELKPLRALVPRREGVRSTRPAGTILEPPKPSLEQGVCYLTFKVSDGSIARMAVPSARITSQARTGTSDGPATPAPPSTPSTSTAPPASTQPPPPQPTPSDTARADRAARIRDAIAQAMTQPPAARPPVVDDGRRTPPPPSGPAQCPPLPKFSAQTLDAALRALAGQRNVRPAPSLRASAMPRGTLLAPPVQQRDADGICHVILVASDGSLVRVPLILGMDQQQARTTVLDARLVFEPADVPSNATPGSVLRQEPRAGAEVPPGTPVRTAVARAPEIAIPNVVGVQSEVARQRLAGFRIDQGIVESVRPAGEIVEQEPAAGERRPRGALVRIAASDGSLVQVPAITGLTVNAAGGRVDGLGLSLLPTTRENAAAPNTIVGQDPPANAVVKRGSRVSVAVSEGLPVPRVIDLPLDAARTALARFKVESVPTESQAELDRVLEQDPAPGARAAGGARVTLRVSDASLVAVPDVRTQALSVADTAISNAGLVRRVTDGPDQADAEVAAQQPLPGVIVRRGTEVSVVVRAPFPWAIVVGAVVTLLAGVGLYRWFRRRPRIPEQKPAAPPINVVATVELAADLAQADDAERRGPDIRVDARVEAGATAAELEERVHA
jgi:beta-lactam-binding protein with PASTA domain